MWGSTEWDRSLCYLTLYPITPHLNNEVNIKKVIIIAMRVIIGYRRSRWSNRDDVTSARKRKTDKRSHIWTGNVRRWAYRRTDVTSCFKRRLFLVCWIEGDSPTRTASTGIRWKATHILGLGKLRHNLYDVMTFSSLRHFDFGNPLENLREHALYFHLGTFYVIYYTEVK